MADKGVQRVLAVINQCFAFRIPPQVSAAGHRADSWPSDPAWTGRLVINASDDEASIELRDPNTGDLFAACPIKRDGPPAVQKVVDSSRYFVLRVVDQKSGRHAFIGIAFENRSDAFDFNVAIDDFTKELMREQVAAEEALKAPAQSKDYSLKQGEKIRIKINTTRKVKDTTDDDWESSGGSGKQSSGDSDLLGFSSGSGQAASNWETF
ncbi:hypothetical protein Poli38472_009708 [Pythium oligandrum]|uniref:NECAP PHear domain-containing protein n=1 Tax=Pythium oligandrum TaxID=41045 RepID=A0A8K1CFE9_PYTOL|nr:hypothetical protein Poli38472_009708 [Pythium oligandrum]|eukprot:TMW62215.1 hypothetical protein Poli38472_009708 [Pythium oligandrum]